MAKVLISDVIVPSLFNRYVMNETVEKSRLVKAGIIQNDPELDKLASGSEGGSVLNMPYWNDLSGASQILSDTVPLSVNKITTGQDRAILHLRGNAWGANELAGVLAGSDPMAAIGSRVAAYWERERQAMLFSNLKGIFASPSLSANVHDISAASGAAANISGNTVLDASQKLGDAKSLLTAIGMHSLVYTELRKQNLIAFIPDAEGKVDIPTYLGLRVIEDDGMPQSGGVFTSYLFGQGAFGFGQGTPPNATETARDALQGDDILINRQKFVLHPRGVKFNSASVAGVSPTNAELEAAANWSRVYDPKKIRIVQFKHKIATT